MVESGEQGPAGRNPDRSASRVPRPAPGLDISEDPRSGHAVVSLPGSRHFEVSHASARLLRLVDGHRSLAEISGLLADELPRPPDPQALEELIRGRFLPLGLVSFGEILPPASRPRSRMWVHLPLLPAAWVGRLAGFLVSLYRRPVVGVALLAGLVVNLWMLLRWGALGWDWNPARVAAGVGGAALFLLSNLVHELGHATALRSRGERPGAIGIGMYYLFPVFYCDVSSAWRLPPRRRIVVDLGGIYFHLLFSLVLGAGFALSGSETLLWTAVMVNLSMVSNLNPFLRFDGYWLMADLSGVRDLRGSTRSVLRSILRREPRAAAEAGNRWLRAYALGSCLYFLGLATYIAWRIVPGVVEDLRHADHLLPGGGNTPGSPLAVGPGEVLFGIAVLVGVLLFVVVGARSLILLWRADRTPRHD